MRVLKRLTSPLFAVLVTNSLQIDNPPKWLKESMVNRVATRIENKLEWNTHRINGHFYATEEEFAKMHGFPGSPILAFYRSATDDLHFGPLVTKENFEMVLTHEMSHAVIAQKYKTHLPKWLEEGLANWVAKNDSVNWKALAALNPRMDVHEAAHPFQALEFKDTQARYLVSLAAVHFLNKACPDFRELLNLSLKADVDTVLPTYCQIQDLNKEFWAFVDKKARS